MRRRSIKNDRNASIFDGDIVYIICMANPLKWRREMLYAKCQKWCMGREMAVNIAKPGVFETDKM